MVDIAKLEANLFEPFGNRIAQNLVSITAIADQVLGGNNDLINAYPEAVRPEGNPVAQAMIDQVFEPIDAPWRGLGMIPSSGLGLRQRYRRFDALKRFELPEPEGDRSLGRCRCGDVITGRCTPPQCSLFGDPCTPMQPIGPCMVSSEGACGAWFKYRPAQAAAAVSAEAGP